MSKGAISSIPHAKREPRVRIQNSTMGGFRQNLPLGCVAKFGNAGPGCCPWDALETNYTYPRLQGLRPHGEHVTFLACNQNPSRDAQGFGNHDCYVNHSAAGWRTCPPVATSRHNCTKPKPPEFKSRIF